ncbi:MAG TPA: flavodoxin family protein [Anaerolineae bacterium]|nr:flavodoxin family protein [Anaerolineae bacterium]
MEISIINGSPRTGGATGTILREISDALANKYNVQVSYYDLSKLRIEACKGCETCYQAGECCIRTDEFEEVANNIKGSDGVIIGSPTHGSNVSAILKNFIDRGHFIVEQALYDKKCFSVVTYEIADGRSTLKILNKFFRVSGGALISSLLVKTGFNQNPLTDRRTLLQLNKQISKYYRATASKRKKSAFEYIFNDLIVVNMIWKRYFKKHPQQFRGILKSYEERGIHPRFLRL